MSKFTFTLLSAFLLMQLHDASAQERGFEVLAGAGYVLDTGEGPSVPTLNGGVTLWLTSNMGIGLQLMAGIGNDHFSQPVEGDPYFLGTGGMRMWAATAEWRGFKRGVEFDFGVGLGRHSFEDHYDDTGIRHAADSINPTIRHTRRYRYETEVIASKFLIGRRLVGPFHLKGGFMLGYADDIQPFQPLVVLSVRPRT